MKVLLVLSLLFVGVVNAEPSAVERRAQFTWGSSTTDCSTCFDKIDKARDCLRECNSKAYPGDNCCCTCKCNGNNGNNNNNYNQCSNNNNNNGDSCKWVLDTNSNNNKWYNIDKYCSCDHVNNNNNKNNCNKNSDLRQSTDDRSLLDFCLDKKSPHQVQDIKDLATCCDFDDKKCDDYFTEVEDCLVGCINPCLVTSAAGWLDCLKDSANDGSCSRQKCLDGFLDDLPSDLHLNHDPNIFDLTDLEKRVEKIQEQDLEDCSLLKEFVDDTCSVGNSCCSKCQEPLGTTVDCLLNGVVIPFASAALNVTVAECPVDTEKCKALFNGRMLTEKEADLFTKAMSLPSNKQSMPDSLSRQLEGDDFNSTAAALECQAKMQTDMLAHNTSYATNEFMQCIMAHGIQVFDDGSTTTSTTKASAAAKVFKLFGVISAMVLTVPV